MAGVAAARALTQAGHEAVVYEKSAGFGGRCATRRQEGFVWDTGATSLALRGQALDATLPQEGLIEIEAAVWTHDDLRPQRGDPARQVRRVTWETGMASLAIGLARSLDVRLDTLVERLEGKTGLLGEVFDGVVLTPPLPQTAQLLWTADEHRPIAHARYRSCVTVCLGYEVPTPPTPWWALIDASRRHPVSWISLESRKSPERAPEGGTAAVIQFSGAYSQHRYRRGDADWIHQASHVIARVLGSDFLQPSVADVKRWKYSQPEQTVDFDLANPVGSRLIVAGDAVAEGRLDAAYASGLRAAEGLIAGR
ncbi:FAD-dependent oxidoreductase [soil metagenome]